MAKINLKLVFFPNMNISPYPVAKEVYKYKYEI